MCAFGVSAFLRIVWNGRASRMAHELDLSAWFKKRGLFAFLESHPLAGT